MNNLDKDIKINIKEIVFSNEDEKSFCDIFIYEPENIEEKSLGNLYIIGEVNNLPENSSYIVNLLASIVKKEFYSNKKRSTLESLESSLNKANSTLTSLAEQGNIEWIGNINMICTAHNNRELHLSQTGHSRILLIRNGQVTDIGKNIITENKAHPFRTFANIASGELEVRDLLLFATPEFFNMFSLEKIKQMSLSNDIDNLTNRIQEALEEKSNIKMMAALLVNITEKEKEKLPQIELNVIEQEIHEEELPITNAPLGIPFEEQIREKDQISDTNLDNMEKLSLEKIIEEYENVENMNQDSEDSKHIIAETIPKNIISGKNEEEEIKEKPINIKVELKKENIEIPHEIAAESEEKRNANKIKMLSIANKAKSKVVSSYSFLRKNIPEKMKSINIKKPEVDITKKVRLMQNGKLIAYVSILALVVLVGNIVFTSYKKKIDENKSKYENYLTQASEKIEKAEGTSIYDNSEARKSLVEAEKLAFDVKNNYKTLGTEADLILNKAQIAIDKIDKISRISNPKVALDFSQNNNIEWLGQLIKLGDKYYSYGKNNSIYELNLEKGLMNEIQIKSKDLGNNAGDFRLSTAIDKLGEIAYLTSNKKIITYNVKKNELKAQNIQIPNEVVNIKDLDAYNSFIYFLNPETNQVYKYKRTSNGFESMQKWMNEPKNNQTNELKSLADMKDAESFSVDGNIYVLQSGGIIEKYRTGAKINSLTEYLENLNSNPTQIYTKDGFRYLYLADQQKNKIILLYKPKDPPNDKGDKLAGTIFRQFIVNEFNNTINSVVIDDKEEKLYVLSGKKVFEFDINQ